MARPSKFEQRRRMIRFAELVAADGSRLEEHAREAGLDPWRALRYLSDPQFRQLVDSFAGRRS